MRPDLDSSVSPVPAGRDPLAAALAALLGVLVGVLTVRTGGDIGRTLPLVVGAATVVIAVFRDPRWGLYAMLVALPLELAGRITSDPFVLTVYHLTLLVTLASWALHAYRRDDAPPVEISAVHLGVLALFVAAVWSLPASLDQAATTIAIVRLAFLLAFFAVFATYLRDGKTMDRVLGVLVGTSAASGALALFQFVRPDLNTGVVNLVGIGTTAVNRPAAFFSDPNYLAGLLSLGIVVALTRALRARRLPDAAPWLLGAAVSAAAIVVTLSRTGWVGLAAGLVVCVLTAPRARRGALLAGVAALVVIGLLAAPGVVAERATSITDVQSDMSVATRYYMYGSTVEMIADRPVFGTGLSAYRVAYPAYRELGAMYDILKPHQLPLALPAEMGVMGLLAEVLIVAGLVAEFLRRRHRGWNVWEAAGVAGLVTLLVQSLFQYYLYVEYVWLFLALTVAAARLTAPAEEV